MPGIAVPDALAILHGLDAIVWQADASGDVLTFVSDGAERLLGYPSREWLVPGFWAEHLLPADHAWAVPNRREARRLGQDHVIEYRMVTADGRVLWVRDHARHVATSAGRSHGVMVDITREKIAEGQ